MTSEMLIAQDVRVAIQQLFASLGEHPERANFQFINIGGVQIGGGGHLGILAVLDALPPPRWDNLVKEMVRATVEHFESQRKAAAYLGVPEKRISYWMLNKIKPEDQNNGEFAPTQERA